MAKISQIATRFREDPIHLLFLSFYRQRAKGFDLGLVIRIPVGNMPSTPSLGWWRVKNGRTFFKPQLKFLLVGLVQ